MRRIIVFVILIGIITGCSGKHYKYTDGKYLGQAEGHHGTIKVEVIIKNKVIAQIDIIEDQEIPGLRDIVYKKIPKAMIKKNTWEVDDISGATLTSTGLKNAVKDAIEDVLEE